MGCFCVSNCDYDAPPRTESYRDFALESGGMGVPCHGGSSPEIQPSLAQPAQISKRNPSLTIGVSCYDLGQDDTDQTSELVPAGLCGARNLPAMTVCLQQCFGMHDIVADGMSVHLNCYKVERGNS